MKMPFENDEEFREKNLEAAQAGWRATFRRAWRIVKAYWMWMR